MTGLVWINVYDIRGAGQWQRQGHPYPSPEEAASTAEHMNRHWGDKLLYRIKVTPKPPPKTDEVWR